MMMKDLILVASFILLTAQSVSAQVVPLAEIADPALRSMQQQAMPRLIKIGDKIRTHRFSHNFYCTRALDIDEVKQRSSDQHSIRFEHFEGTTVLAISGSYYAAYSADHFDTEQRARDTFLSVVVPLAKASVPVFANDQTVQGFAFEISHHVIAKVVGESIERPENLMVYLPRTAALRLANAETRDSQQAALLDGEVFVNASPLKLWLGDDESPTLVKADTASPAAPVFEQQTKMGVLPVAPPSMPTAIPSATVMTPSEPTAKDSVIVAPMSVEHKPISRPAGDLSPTALAVIQQADQMINDRLVRELGKQAHLLPIAPPAFIGFHHEIYLDLSLETRLKESFSASRYKLAALAFDDHVSPLIRQVLLYFQGHTEFDGVDFSSTVSIEPKPGATYPRKPISVEFFLSLNALRSYENYDLTGQQLLNSGIILINGERAQLDLQEAESDGHP